MGKPKPETVVTDTYPVKGQASRPWHQDPRIIERMKKVWELICEGKSNYVIADALKVDIATVRMDVRRLETVWMKDLSVDVDRMRARKVVELEDIARRAIQAADEDRKHILAVLYDEPYSSYECPGRVSHGMDATGLPATACPAPHVIELRAYRDAKGSAQYRSQLAAALNVARQARMDQATLLGLVVNKIAPVSPDGTGLGEQISTMFGQLTALANGDKPSLPEAQVVEVTVHDVRWECPVCHQMERYEKGDIKRWPEGRDCTNPATCPGSMDVAESKRV